MCLLNAVVTNFTEMMVVRFFLGVAEAGMAPTLIFYLTSFYTRSELAQRICAFYSMLAVAGAFSGLLSYGICQVDNNWQGWRVLFLVEGVLTIVLALISRGVLPRGINACSFWSDESRMLARRRILRDSSTMIEEEHSLATFFAPLQEPMLYIFFLVGLCYGTSGAVAGTFLPLVMARMGFDPAQTNLLTVGPNVLGAFCVYITAKSSDYFRERSLHLLAAMSVTFLGLVILLVGSSTNLAVNYGACFLISAGAFTPSVLFHTWHNCNDASHDGRAFRTGLLTLATNSGGIVAANIFLSWEAPRYTTAILASALLEGVGITLVLSTRLWMMRDNNRRDQLEGITRSTKDISSALTAKGTKHASF
ncbi:MFS general substrate transporter, partial [Dacryopinax primogenitus]